MLLFRKIIAFLVATFTFFSAWLTGNGNIYKECYMMNEVVYGSANRQVLDLCLPRDKSETGLILMIHGGAWTSGDKKVYHKRIEDYCTRMGYAAASINYRYLSEKVSMFDILDDITAAVDAIQKTAAKKNINITGMLLTGHSAGGHLAELYAYKCADISPIPPKAVVAEAGPTDLTDINLLTNNDLFPTPKLERLFSNACGQPLTVAELDKAMPILQQLSPVFYVSADTVPTVICHGVLDSIVPFGESVTLNEKMDEFGVRHDFIPFPNSNHGLEKDPDCTQKEIELFEEYARTYLD